MKVLFYIVITFFTIINCIAQNENEIIVESTSIFVWDKNVDSKSSAIEKLKKQAEREALESKFSMKVDYTSDINTTTNNTNGQINGKTTFDFKSRSNLAGEIIKVLKDTVVEVPKSKKEKSDQNVSLKCFYKAIARELKTPKIKIEAVPLKKLGIIKLAETFNVGEQMFLYFKSPVSGYLYIFYDDGTTAQRILPYTNMGSNFENGVKVEADKEYVFFSKKDKYFENDETNIDELEFLEQQKEIEISRLYVIFSKAELNKPGLEADDVSKLTEAQKMKKYTLPPSLSSEEFDKWRVENLLIRSDLQVETLFITVKKKP